MLCYANALCTFHCNGSKNSLEEAPVLFFFVYNHPTEDTPFFQCNNESSNTDS